VVVGLLRRLDDESVQVRRAAVEALAELGRAADEVVGPLASRLKDPSPEVRAAAAWALGELGVPRASILKRLRAMLAHKRNRKEVWVGPGLDSMPVYDYVYEALWRLTEREALSTDSGHGLHGLRLFGNSPAQPARKGP